LPGQIKINGKKGQQKASEKNENKDRLTKKRSTEKQILLLKKSDFAFSFFIIVR
jgi:hypothetical protein